MKKKNRRSEEELLSASELSLLRNTSEDRSQLPPHDTSDRANAVRFAKKNPVFMVSACIILAFLIAALIFGGIMLVNYLDSRPCTDDFTIYLGKDSYEMPYDVAMREGVLYIDVKPIAKYAGLITSGSEQRIKFTASDEHYLRFENESEFAVISGSKVEMPTKAIVSKDLCLVPFDFFTKTLAQGLRVKLDTKTNVIKVTRQLYEDTKEPADLLFSCDGFTVIQAIKPVKKEEISADAYPFDIGPYLSYINPERANEYLILANKQNALPETYVPSDLVGLMSAEIGVPAKNESLKLRRNAAYALKAMMQAMGTENPAMIEELLVTSAYRDYDYQQMLYERYVNDYLSQGMTEEEAKAAASRTSARPGESEHQTGLCFDFITESMSGVLDERFENTLAFDWLKDHAHLYGFILRYPSDKVNLTGYDYEPWHFRFVGREAAVEIYNSKLCLEEYLELN